MKILIFILFIGISIFSCEDVVEVNLNSIKPKLVIDGIVPVDLSLECVPVKIKTTLSSSFYENNTPVSVTSVTMYIETYNEYGDTESTTTLRIDETVPGSGIYERCLPPDSFNTEFGYFLSVTYNDRFYLSKTEFVPSTHIEDLNQGEETLIDKNEKEIIVSFQDNVIRNDLYVFKFGDGNFITFEDDFFQGENYRFSYFLDDRYHAGDTLEVTLLGADRQFYNYISLLVEQTGEGLSIFSTPAATIRGNIFDFTDIDNRDNFDNVKATNNYPLGYFAIVEADKKTLVLE